MIKRSYILGEEWLYYKLYCGVKTSDILLLDLVHPLIHELITAKLINRWFFVRFFDPDPHLRIRLNIDNAMNLGAVIEICAKYFKIFLDNGTIWRVQADTYFRELERYGHYSIEYAEEIFYYDSNLIINLLKQKYDIGTYLWGVLKSVDSFLELFEFGAEQKHEFYQTGKIAFNTEFGLSHKQISSIISIISQNYSHVFDQGEFKLNSDDEFIGSIVADRNNQSRSAVTKIFQLKKSKKLEIPLSVLVQDYVHMFFNKAFYCQQRGAELIGYNLKYLQKI